MAEKPFYTAENFHCRSSVGYLVRRLHNLMVPQIEERFEAAELTFTHWVVLMGLSEGRVRTCADAARHLGHDSGATTRLLDQLEARGMVERRRDPKDRRVNNLVLTAKGRAMSKKLAPRVLNFWNEILDDFSHAEATALIAMLTHLQARLEEKADNATMRAKAAR